MAALREYDEEEQVVRPRRHHRPPGHLDDYVLSYHSHEPDPVISYPDMNTLSSNTVSVQRTSTPMQGAEAESLPDMDRLMRMERCVSQVQDQMRELQNTLHASLHLGRSTLHAQLPQQARSLSMPLITDPDMGSLKNIAPFASLPHSPEQTTVQRVSSPAVLPVTMPSAPLSTTPAFGGVGSTTQPVYVLSSAQNAARPAPVVSRPAASDHPHPPWQQHQQQRGSNWPIPYPARSTQPYMGQPSFPEIMQPQPSAFPSYPVPPVGSLPWTSGPIVSNPHSAQVISPDVSAQYIYRDPAFPPQPPASAQPGALQDMSHYTSPMLAAQRPNLMEMAISSSYGIPKPRLVSFTTGKESDFLLLKKGLDGVMGPHPHLSEDYKFQVLLDHLKFPAAFQIAKRYVHDPMPYTKSMQALQQRYGQPRQLVQSEINSILRAPTVRAGDAQGFEDFALAVSSLVGLLDSLKGAAKSELECGSHVDRLLSKLPPSYQDSFAEFCLTRGILQSDSVNTYTLPDFARWLERKSQAIQISRRATENYTAEKPRSDRREKQPKQLKSSSSIYYGTEKAPTHTAVNTENKDGIKGKKREKFKPYCPFCSSTEHYLNSCPDFVKLSTAQVVSWINENKRCWKCGRGHQPDSCTLKKPCATCGEQHLQILHEASSSTNRSVLTLSTASSMVYLDQAAHSGRVMLKVVPVTLHSKGRSLLTHAILDDGSERTIILSAAVHYLQLEKTVESIKLRTIRQEVSELKGANVTFNISPPQRPQTEHHISSAFTAAELNLAKQSCPMDTLRQKYPHLSDVPFEAFKDVQPMLLIGSDNAHLITPLSQVKAGPLGTPVAVETKLGWAIQGPATFLHEPTEASCLHTSLLPSPTQVLRHNVEKLWQLDVLPFRSEKEATRSKQDREALELLQNQTERVEVDGVFRYATPLLRHRNAPKLHAGTESVMALLRATEKRLIKDPDLAAVYNAEIHRLEQAGYARKLTPDEARSTDESWFIPHHIVYHNNKARVVFNCSFHYKTDCLNDQLLSGPILGPPLIGVLLRFREYPVAVSGDIRGMFHQVRLLTKDMPLLRFIWRDMERERTPDIYEWSVLPFGTTCSPCCAIYALQRHVQEHKVGNEQVLDCVMRSFYVDNCLKSLPSPSQARPLIDNTRELLATGGFEVRQWASNLPEAVAHLPSDARSPTCELWLTTQKSDPQEPTLGLAWHCSSDHLSYRCRSPPDQEPTMRNIYSILASQYDPLGFIVPFTTRAKLIVQLLWQKERHWDEPIDGELLQLWQEWELTEGASWRHVPSALNPADDITRGKVLLELSAPGQWRDGPSFLRQNPEHWPSRPSVSNDSEEDSEFKKSALCAYVSVCLTQSDLAVHDSWADLVQATYLSSHGAAAPSMSAEQRIEAEIQLLRLAQLDSFPAEVKALSAGKDVHSDSKLNNLSPEYDTQLGLIRVGVRLRRAENIDIDTLHPIVLSPEHTITQLIIKDYDSRLMHPGPERVFAELRRTYWVLRGRQAIRKHQHHCLECKTWRANPVTPKMSDLPASRLRLQQPPFWSTGIDCFGPFTIKIGRRQEKRWGIIFKCLTTRCVHLELLSGMDTDSFLMALRRFIARRGKPFEIISDQGTNFRGGNRELQEAFKAMEPQLQEKLSEQSITFHFNPPHAPHFGGAWEREIRSVKSALQVVLQGQSVSEDLLHTVLIEVEGILNSKPLGYVSSDIADIDPITPNMLLMGRRDASLPQAVYGIREQLGRRKWRHSQVIADHFWTQFTQRYLPALQHRQKWQRTVSPLTVGQVVMVVDAQLPRALWPVGKVSQVFPSSDGQVRAAEVTIGEHTYRRPVAKLVVLPVMPTDSA
ncbi:uncharacterized protein LOC114458488 [Gouania willdenowi]|uniref:uncharacterized protein LOC114458488 n=1 Tax=Gouania willdenowi TaxID=441366 RepID=UPI001054B960|nr:uncharacterized protein LOC114458488 [Gouania willdenowi]